MNLFSLMNLEDHIFKIMYQYFSLNRVKISMSESLSLDLEAHISSLPELGTSLTVFWERKFHNSFHFIPLLTQAECDESMKMC